MRKRPKLREDDFPPPGTVFIAPTRDGRLAAGRVLRRQFEGGAQAALIATTPWLGNEPPHIELDALRETLILSHHAWKSKPDMCWVFDPLPPEFTVIGQVELSAQDLKATCGSFGGWQGVPLQAMLQWRWDNDREALLRDEARQAVEQKEARQKVAAARAELMRTLTLDSLANQSWFVTWKNSGSKLPLDECRSLITQLISQLRTAPKLTLGVVKKHLKKSVEDFNRLDSTHHFISTIEREDLCEVYEQIACAAKFPQVIDQIEQWREW